ncbi:MAG: PRTRC system protein E [Burkholderiaceae bacterium]|nr:PRTRC system protein E [Burkholderiaceae bacterium]
MFTALHGLAQSATLMIVVAADGDQLRVSITPTATGDKTKPHALRPLSLLATPAELDADFAAALAIWQAPKRSLIEQAQAAAGEDPDEDAGESSNGAATEPAAPKKEKPGRKKKADAPANPGIAQGDAGAGPQPVELEGAEESKSNPEIAPPPAPAQPPAADEFTLDLF